MLGAWGCEVLQGKKFLRTIKMYKKGISENYD
jgi:hypothetical protein